MGLRLGKGEKLADITASMSAVAEGILTTRSAHDLAAKLGIEAPIIDGIFRVRCHRTGPVKPAYSAAEEPSAADICTRWLPRGLTNLPQSTGTVRSRSTAHRLP